MTANQKRIESYLELHAKVNLMITLARLRLVKSEIEDRVHDLQKAEK